MTGQHLLRSQAPLGAEVPSRGATGFGPEPSADQTDERIRYAEHCSLRPEVFVLRTIGMVSTCVAMIIASTAVRAAAQAPPDPPLDMSVGYQAMHIPGQTYPFGVSLDISGALTDTIRIVGEVGVSVATQTTSSYGSGTLTLYQYAAGPRFMVTASRVRLFAQALAGGVRTHADLTTTSGSPFIDGDSAFMLQPGGGVIVPLTGNCALIASADYQRVFFKEYGGDNETRAFLGLQIALRRP